MLSAKICKICGLGVAILYYSIDNKRWQILKLFFLKDELTKIKWLNQITQTQLD